MMDLRQQEIRNRLLERLENKRSLLFNDVQDASWIEDEAHECFEYGRKNVWTQRVTIHGREMFRVNNS